MSEKFTIKTATDDQKLEVLDYIYKNEPVKLRLIADEIPQDNIFDIEDYFDLDFIDPYGDFVINSSVDWPQFDDDVREAVFKWLISKKPSESWDIDVILEGLDEALYCSAEFKKYFAEKCEEYQNQ